MWNQGAAEGSGITTKAKGCLGAMLGLVMTVTATCSAGVFAARDVVSTYFAEPARAMGLDWFAAQPRPSAGKWQYGGSSCELTWRRAGLETAKYSISCLGDVDMVLSDFEIVSTLSPDQTEDGEVFEFQGPMSGEAIRVESRRRWRYDGTIWLGSSLPFWGVNGPRHLVLTASVDYPDASESVRKRIEREAQATHLLLIASEPSLGIRP